MKERERIDRRKREKERRPQAPVGPSVSSLCHPWITTTNLSYGFPIFETSATALCGTTGIHLWIRDKYICIIMYLHIDWPSSKANLAFSVHMLKCHAADTPFQLSIGHQNAQARITVDAEIGIRTCFFLPANLRLANWLHKVAWAAGFLGPQNCPGSLGMAAGQMCHL